MADTSPFSGSAGADDLDFDQTLRGFRSGQLLSSRYTLKRILGRGGMGVVWLARDEELSRDIALKFLPEELVRDREAIADLKRETRRSLELTHQNIVRIHDFVPGESWAAISMEYIEGDSLSGLKVNQSGGCFDATVLLPWVEQLCAALSYAHEEAHLVHRDLKPANLMINSRGKLKVADFGIAASLSDSLTRVSLQAAGISGSPPYMSPQQALGERPTVADDIYSLGATLYDLLTGKPPFFRGTANTILHQIQSVVPPAMEERRAELQNLGAPIPWQWEQAIAACLEKEPGRRPRTVAEVLSRLRGETSPHFAPQPAQAPLRVTEPQPAATPSHPIGYAPVPQRERPTRSSAYRWLIFFVLMAVGAGGLSLLSGSKEQLEATQSASVSTATTPGRDDSATPALSGNAQESKPAQDNSSLPRLSDWFEIPTPAENAPRFKVLRDLRVVVDEKPYLLKTGEIFLVDRADGGEVVFVAGDHQIALPLTYVEMLNPSGAKPGQSSTDQSPLAATDDPSNAEESPSEATKRAQREAIRRYPALGQKGSPENQLFIDVYQELKHSEAEDFFSDPQWPLQLAELLAKREGWKRAE